MEKQHDDDNGISIKKSNVFEPAINIGYYSVTKTNLTDGKLQRKSSAASSDNGIYVLRPKSLMFRDGIRKIDMIICYKQNEENEYEISEFEKKRHKARTLFQQNLIKDGLNLEIEDKSHSLDGKTNFIKIHLPTESEMQYSKVLNVKLPVKRFITISVKNENTNQEMNVYQKLVKIFQNLCSYDRLVAANEATFSSVYAKGNGNEQFIIKDRCTSFTSSQRSWMVFQILLRAKYDDSQKRGILQLLNNGTFHACYPLHEGHYDRSLSSGAILDRRLLYLSWASPTKFYKKQPLCLIRKYFGDKYALYFCWLGFYTNMLIYPAIVGTICFLYGIITINSDDNIISKEICNETGPGSITLCPMCAKGCDYQKLSNSCLFAQITHLFDNSSTVLFAIFMSFWATTLLELWKRKQAVIIWEWDLQNIADDEENRPEFENAAKTFRINPVTKEKEPYVSTLGHVYRYFVTATVALLMICIMILIVLGIIIFEIFVMYAAHRGSNGLLKIYTKIISSTINLIIIMILSGIYRKVAVWLTNLENPRTQTEYADSYTFKLFFFEFINSFGSLIYIAFFKGRFYKHPGYYGMHSNLFGHLVGDICDPVGCLSELCIQLAIIMVGKHIWKHFVRNLFPKCCRLWQKLMHKKQIKNVSGLLMAWEQDYYLQEPGRLALFDEYLTMILQYGFVTLFVAAFPLAPLFALINNILEIRFYAYKMIRQSRRPLAERTEDIGAWFNILKVITYAAVVSNAFVIAYTSDYVPRMVFKYGQSNDSTFAGYIDYSISEFNTSDFMYGWNPGVAHNKTIQPFVCQYRGYRKPPNVTELPNSKTRTPPKYDLTSDYWHVFTARLAFVICFEHIIFVLTGIMKFIIPDIPVEMKTQMQREALLTKEEKYQNGIRKSQIEEYNDMMQKIKNSNSRPDSMSST